jgi:ubiquinone/menaquinone biosynthesis C-methylase UbiE
MTIYASEITSDKHLADGPLHHRLLKAYYAAIPYVKGDLLEIGCGEGRGIELLSPLVNSYTAIDKISEIEDGIRQKYPKIQFLNMNVPPFTGVADNSFDTIVTFQVIEHIQEDKEFLKEIYRVLRSGGRAILSTPNLDWSLTRNPWHVREYTARQFEELCSSIFPEVVPLGINGNDKIWKYYEENKRSVAKYKRFDIFGLEKRLPTSILRIPYDILNRMNRNQLKSSNENLVTNIGQDDYFVSENAEKCFDLFYILKK